MDIRITVQDSATPMLRALPRNLERALLAATEDAATTLVREMKLYPPKRAGSKYRRTLTLMGSWFYEVRSVPGGVRGEVFSTGQKAPYNVWVQKATHQATIHRGVWQTEASVAERLRPQIVRFYEIRIGAVTST